MGDKIKNRQVLLLHVPPSLEPFSEHIMWFLDGMIKKLDKNSYKKTPTVESIPGIIDKLQCEVIEFEEQLAKDKFAENTLIELMDVANFAFLAYVALRNEGVEHEQKTTYTEVG